ncbi:MAG: non-canonical purine NTP pyrophosphatase [Verrucomicrobiae bacterium]|nr:non-canonical purine NTP pyrophosphatase [Verrucomicrobiae bacterium]
MLRGVTTVVIATRNGHKVEEIRAVLGEGFRVLGAAEVGDVPDVEETGTTFVENARLKAEALAAWLRGPRAANEKGGGRTVDGSWAVLADDSGLEVDALGGAPGVHSARFASADFGLEGNAPDAANNARLMRLLAAVPWEGRTARFRCVLVWEWLDDQVQGGSFDGTCEGRIGWVPRGSRGFGYDPLFVPEGGTDTLAELGEAVKNRISHRARALERLRAWLGSGCGVPHGANGGQGGQGNAGAGSPSRSV